MKKKKIFSLFLVLVFLFSLTACGKESAENQKESSAGTDQNASADADQRIDDDTDVTAASSGNAISSEKTVGRWSVYWYLCGSDLESGGGCATADLSELMEVELPEGVNVVIETGGAAQWQNDLMDAGKLQR